jgi:hypothetical protein
VNRALKLKFDPLPNRRVHALHEPTGMTSTETLNEIDRRNLDSGMKKPTAAWSPRFYTD